MLCLLISYFPPMGQWMDYRCKLGSLGNSSIALGRRDPGGTVGSSYSLGRLDIFFLRARFTFFHSHYSLLTLFFSFILFHFCCSHDRVFGKILLHEFHISSPRTEWYLILFLLACSAHAMCWSEKVEILRNW